MLNCLVVNKRKMMIISNCILPQLGVTILLLLILLYCGNTYIDMIVIHNILVMI